MFLGVLAQTVFIVSINYDTRTPQAVVLGEVSSRGYSPTALRSATRTGKNGDVRGYQMRFQTAKVTFHDPKSTNDQTVQVDAYHDQRNPDFGGMTAP